MASQVPSPLLGPSTSTLTISPPSAEGDTLMRKLTKSRPLFFARRSAADPPRARSAAPPRSVGRTHRRRGERAQYAAVGRPSLARQRAAGWELGREGRRKEREKKEDLWHCGGGGGGGGVGGGVGVGRRGKRSSIILASTDGGTEGRRDGREEGRGRHSLHRGWHGGTRRPTDRQAQWQQRRAASPSWSASLQRGRTYVLLRARCGREEWSKSALHSQEKLERRGKSMPYTQYWKTRFFNRHQNSKEGAKGSKINRFMPPVLFSSA